MKAEWMDVYPGGRTYTKDNTFDCAQHGCIVGISFANDGNQNVLIEFGGAKRLLVPGREFTHFTNYPYRNKGQYKITFVETSVPATEIQQVNVYFLKANAS